MTSVTSSEQVPRSVLQVVLHTPRPVRILIFGIFISRTGSFFATFATLFLTDRGFATETLPAVLVAIGVAGMVGSLAGGWLADHIGHRATLVLSMLASAAAVAMLVVSPTRALIVVAVCAVSLCTQAYTPAASALLIVNTEPADRVPTFAFFRLALNVGSALGALIAGVIATRSYTILFIVEAIAYAACALFIFLGLRHARPESELAAALEETGEQEAATEEPLATLPPAPSSARHLPPWTLCLLLFGVAAVYAQYQSTLPLQLVSHGHSTAFYGALLALNGLLVIVFELPISSVTRRLPWVLPILGGVLLMTAGLVVAAMVTLAAVIIVAFIAFTVGEMAFAPVANAAVAELSPPGTEARYQGLLATAQSLGFSLGPAIGMSVFAHSHDALWLGTSVLTCALAVGLYAVWRISQ
ncbi:MAG TPA: MFS transporter [Jatrophihabitans sp.]|jgi:predicted MFS family arabinose efflux permease|uniref:MFS transporter n=1 Tax=Jatrophihabitans sp. TaxID=1932789 RepID=UPI002F16A180